MKGTGAIYSVRYLGQERVCYVGQTRRDPGVRWAEHMRGRSALARAIKLLGGDANDWEFAVIERVPIAQLNDREAFWIAALDTLYPNGMNHSPGGVAGVRTLASTRARLSASLVAAFSSDEFRAWRSAASKGMWADPAKRQNIIDGARAAWERPERRERHKAAMKAVMADPDRRARISASMKEHRRRLRESKSVRPASA